MVKRPCLEKKNLAVDRVLKLTGTGHITVESLRRPPTHPSNHLISWKSILDSQQSRKSGSFYVVRCPHPIDKVCAVSPPSKYMIFPEPNCYPFKKIMCGVPPSPLLVPCLEYMCGVPPLGIHFFCAVSPPPI